MGAGRDIAKRHFCLPASYFIWLKQWVQHSMMEKGQIEQMIQRWDEDKRMFEVGGGEGVVLEVTFTRLSQIMNFFCCFKTQLVFLSMKEFLENLCSAILIVSNNNSLY